jgi:hypothetical protein
VAGAWGGSGTLAKQSEKKKKKEEEEEEEEEDTAEEEEPAGLAGVGSSSGLLRQIAFWFFGAVTLRIPVRPESRVYFTCVWKRGVYWYDIIWIQNVEL